LVLVEYGAIGISISSFLIGYEFYFEDNYFEIIVTSIISGFSQKWLGKTEQLG